MARTTKAGIGTTRLVVAVLVVLSIHAQLALERAHVS
jgi:hypothetical protein